jgi:hypothetical protein
MNDRLIPSYPYEDEYGYLWFDSCTFKVEPEPCFYCGAETDRLDINFEAHYCGTHSEEIAADLRSLDDQYQ